MALSVSPASQAPDCIDSEAYSTKPNNNNNNNNNNNDNHRREPDTQRAASASRLRGGPQECASVDSSHPTKMELSACGTRRLRDFYRNRVILITGATGFVGKVCLAKLVRCLAVWDRIYVVLRAKKGLSAQQRLNKLLGEEPFGAKSCTKVREPARILALEGDMSKEQLGLSAEHRQKVLEGVEVIFNLAASVQFDAPLKQNLRDNYLGTRNLLHLATGCRRLISLVHVSTFFSNSHQAHIEELVLPMERDHEKMAELISWLPESLCDTVAPHMMESRPNTYIYTKAMAENLVQRYDGRLPIAIVRPSIVTPAAADPEPGWVDNVNGPMGLGVLASLGILRNIDWNYYGVADFIPVDCVANCMLAVAERTARRHPKQIKVYNCSSSSLKPITWGQGFEELRKEGLKAPPYKMLRLPIEVPKHRRANRLTFGLTKLSELLFAYLIDFILTLCGQKRILIRLTQKLHHGYKILLPFTTTQYTCSNDNLLAAYEELSEEDRKQFQFDVRQLDWQAIFKDSYLGSRRRLLKEDPSNVPAALFKMRILQVVEAILKFIFYATILIYSYRLMRYFYPTVLAQN